MAGSAISRDTLVQQEIKRTLLLVQNNSSRWLLVLNLESNKKLNKKFEKFAIIECMYK